MRAQGKMMTTRVDYYVIQKKEEQGRIHDNPVADGWAGAVMSLAGAVMSWARAEMS